MLQTITMRIFEAVEIILPYSLPDGFLMSIPAIIQLGKKSRRERLPRQLKEKCFDIFWKYIFTDKETPTR